MQGIDFCLFERDFFRFGWSIMAIETKQRRPPRKPARDSVRSSLDRSNLQVDVL